ncbi:MAG TPA: ABC transporter ATP-binding protein [Nitratifractor sp.]|jgi:ABC-2 type transport system ATP-binding protein|nr:ABC transporter ATP-binding protein [Nitratifractor sp.]HHD74960.1 ABC transporter ATP-binding protein [Nitratifractor sp.]HHH20519.1 ABC transporter ATP-binding protein [Nitratifractor sp.]
MSAVTISKLFKSYGSSEVIKGLNMDVREGEIYGLLGPNGAGKSTLIRVILGLLPYEKGEVLLFGKPLMENLQKLSKEINALPEFFEPYSWMKNIEYLQFFADLYGADRAPVRIRSLLESVGLDPNDNKVVGEYSQGMRKRLGLARALVNRPKLLILDEPTNGLDPKGRREIHDLLLNINRNNKTTIILSTHILDDVERLCDRIGVLDNGLLQYEGALHERTEQQHYRYRFEISNKDFDAKECEGEQIRFISQKESWVECEITNITPNEALKSLLNKGIEINQAVALEGSLEHLYFSVTGGEK